MEVFTTQNDSSLLNVTHTVIVDDYSILKISAAYLIVGLLVIAIGSFIKN